MPHRSNMMIPRHTRAEIGSNCRFVVGLITVIIATLEARRSHDSRFVSLPAQKYRAPTARDAVGVDIAHRGINLF